MMQCQIVRFASCQRLDTISLLIPFFHINAFFLNYNNEKCFHFFHGVKKNEWWQKNNGPEYEHYVQIRGLNISRKNHKFVCTINSETMKW